MQEEEGGSDGGGPQVGTRFSASEIHENISKEAKSEMERPVAELAWSGLASGLLIGFSFLMAAFFHGLFPPHLSKLATALGYPIGFVFVVLGRHQLFTENTLEPVIPLLEQRTRHALGKVLRLWSIVLPFNLLGALLLGIVVAHTSAMPPEMHSSLEQVAQEATRGSFGEILYKGIWAGWLVALMAWLIASTHDTMAQIALIFLTTMPIAALGFKHSIAGAVEGFYLTSLGRLPWGDMLVRFELATLLGNIIGGVVLVAMVNHGQAAGESSE